MKDKLYRLIFTFLMVVFLGFSGTTVLAEELHTVGEDKDIYEIQCKEDAAETIGVDLSKIIDVKRETISDNKAYELASAAYVDSKGNIEDLPVEVELVDVIYYDTIYVINSDIGFSEKNDILHYYQINASLKKSSGSNEYMSGTIGWFDHAGPANKLSTVSGFAKSGVINKIYYGVSGFSSTEVVETIGQSSFSRSNINKEGLQFYLTMRKNDASAPLGYRRLHITTSVLD